MTSSLRKCIDCGVHIGQSHPGGTWRDKRCRPCRDRYGEPDEIVEKVCVQCNQLLREDGPSDTHCGTCLQLWTLPDSGENSLSTDGVWAAAGRIMQQMPDGKFVDIGGVRDIKIEEASRLSTVGRRWSDPSTDVMGEIAKIVHKQRRREVEAENATIMEDPTLRLTPEELEGVRKFFNNMKTGAYIKCPQCGNWKRNPPNPSVDGNGAIYCSVQCANAHTQSITQHVAQMTRAGILTGENMRDLMDVAKGASASFQKLNEVWNGDKSLLQQTPEQIELDRVRDQRKRDQEARKRGLSRGKQERK